MNKHQKFLPLLLILLAGLLSTFVLLRLHNRLRPLAVYPQAGQEISVYGKIGVTFNQPVQIQSIEDHFVIQPQVAGDFYWEGQTLWFIPHDPLEPGQVYQAAIAPGAEAANGRKLRTSITWYAPIREPGLLYLVLDTIGGDLWRYDFTSGSTDPLTHTDGGIVDFTPSLTGDVIAYAQRNDSGGSDLWLVDRDGTNPKLLLDCAQDLCSQLAWSVDAEWIAYARESFQAVGGRHLAARVWTVNLASGETAPLYRQDQAYGHSPSFSPDGQRLATYDSVNQAIRILNLHTSQESAIPTLYPGTGHWSPSGEELIFIDLVPSVLEPNVAIYIVNFQTQDIRPALGEFIPNMDYDPPQWSPNGEWIAYGLRPVDAGISKGIWINNLSEGDALMLTDDPSATHVGYRWDPWGERLAFQRFPISGPISHASLWLWERATGEIHRLVENGARPEWLP